MHSQRIEVLKDNEKHVENGGKDDWDSSSDDDADVGDENINGLNGENNDDFEDDDSDAEWDKQQQLLGKLGKLKKGEALTAGEAKEFGLDEDEDSDDSDDEDYEYNGGDGSLYDSRIDNIDELKTLRDTLMEISQADPTLYARIMSGITDQDQLSKFEGLMGGVDGLCEREASVRRKIEELEKTNKESSGGMVAQWIQ